MTVGESLIPTESPDPAELVRVEAALRRLPRLERDILLAVRLDGLGTAAIARRTGLSQAEVQRLLARAIEHFTHALEHPRRHCWRRWWWR